MAKRAKKAQTDQPQEQENTLASLSDGIAGALLGTEDAEDATKTEKEDSDKSQESSKVEEQSPSESEESGEAAADQQQDPKETEGVEESETAEAEASQESESAPKSQEKPVESDQEAGRDEIAKEEKPVEAEEPAEIDEVLKELRQDLGDDLADKIDRLATAKAERAKAELRKEAKEEQKRQQEIDAHAAMLSKAAESYPNASEEHLRLAARMVRTGCIEAEKGKNPYDIALGQLNIPNPSPTSSRPKASRSERIAASSMASDYGGSTEETTAEITGLDADSIREAMDQDHPVFAGLFQEEK